MKLQYALHIMPMNAHIVRFVWIYANQMHYRYWGCDMMIVLGTGYTVDCDYLINVKDCMERVFLPAPRRRLTDNDGTRLPIITIDTEDMQ